jgi:hypothetical protein
MNFKSILSFLILFLSLLYLSNLYLLKPGIWLFQDASYWPKTSQEAVMMINQQLHTFTNNGYYLGFDAGLFNFTRIEVYLLSGLLFWLFGAGGSQAALSIIGLLMSFAFIYLMTGIFFKEKKVRYILSLLYVFNPIMYSLQGHTYYGITVPLFIYSFYQLFKRESDGRLIYFLLNVVSVFFWIAYIRFIPINAIVIIPYIIYLLLSRQLALTIKRIVIYITGYVFLLSPVLYSFINQLMEGSNTAFNYRFVYGLAVSKLEFFEAFNPFLNLTVHLYSNPIYTIIGLTLSVFLVWLIWLYKQQRQSKFWLLNLSLVLFGILCFGLANIFGETGYKALIQYFPFVINGPLFAFFIIWVPIVLLLGKLTENRIRYLYIFAGVFIFIGIFPLLNINNFELQKTVLSDIPESYQRFFIDEYDGISESTYYPYSTCWRSQYMNVQNIPTSCFNFGLHYPSMLLNDPRLVSGSTYQFAKELTAMKNIDNLRITHNLKHIIVPNDMVLKNGPGSNTTTTELDSVPATHKILRQNQQLLQRHYSNFTDYTYKNKDNYDFFIYSPKSVFSIDTGDWLTRPLDINTAPVLLEKVNEQLFLTPEPNTIWYKIDPNNPTVYYLKLANNSPLKPFLLQLNQSFHQSWKIKSISKNIFDDIKCETEWKYFSITNNYHCKYKTSITGLMNIRLITDSVLPEVHLRGNLLSNSWVLQSPTEESYFAIIFQKQVMYYIAILLSLGSITLLILGTVAQEIIIKYHKYD